MTPAAPPPRPVPAAVPTDPRFVDWGHRFDARTVELAVVVDAAEALSQRLQSRQPRYLLLHGLGAPGVARQMLASLAETLRRPPQQLLIRHAAQQQRIATLDFIDCPTRNGEPLRLVLGETEGAPELRERLASVLVAHSALSLLLVGRLSGVALEAALARWTSSGPQPGGWLFLPLVDEPGVHAGLQRLRQGRCPDAVLTPTVGRPSEAWTQLCACWNEMQRRARPGVADADLALLPSLSARSPAASAGAGSVGGTPAAPAPAPGAGPTPPPVTATTSRPGPLGDGASRSLPLGEALAALGSVPGVQAAVLLDAGSGRVLSRCGPGQLAERLAAEALRWIALIEAGALRLQPPEGQAAAARSDGPRRAGGVLSLGDWRLALRRWPGAAEGWVAVLLDDPARADPLGADAVLGLWLDAADTLRP